MLYVHIGGFFGCRRGVLTHVLQPSVGAICVDMSRMDRILEIHGAYLLW